MTETIIPIKQLKDFVTLKKGKPPAQQPYYGKHAETYLTPEYLRGKAIADTIKASTNAVRVNESDIIVLWDGSNAGEIFRARAGVLASTMSKIEFGKNFDKDYFYYAIKDCEYYLKSQTSGSGIPHVDKEIFGKLEIREFPDLEQNKIAEILSKIDQIIKQTVVLIAKQQHVKIGLVRDLLTRGIDEYDKLRSPSTHKFKESPLGLIPKEWESLTINELSIHVGSGVTPRGGEVVYSKEGVLFIRSQNVHFGELLLNDVAYIPTKIHDSMRRSEVFENDVLLNITGASIGRCCVVPKMSCSINVNQHVCAIRLNNAMVYDAGFLAAVIESSIGQRQISQFNAGGNREGLNYQQVRSFVIPWPKEGERQKSYGLIRKSMESLKTLDLNLEKLRLLKIALMQDLLTGERRVTELLNTKEFDSV